MTLQDKLAVCVIDMTGNVLEHWQVVFYDKWILSGMPATSTSLALSVLFNDMVKGLEVLAGSIEGCPTVEMLELMETCHE